MDDRVKRAIALMRQNLCRNLTLAEIAESVCLSNSRLGHLFKAETGLGPLQYLRLLRMQEAKLLLRTSFLSVKEIMTKIGIKDESHFFRDFKRAHGVTPVQYRRANSIQDYVLLLALALAGTFNWQVDVENVGYVKSIW